MAVPTYSDGSILSASDLNNWLIDQVVIKGTAEHRSNNTLANDAVLSMAVAANAQYLVDLSLIIDGATNGDFAGAWTVPASASILSVWGTGTDVAGTGYATDVTFAGGTTFTVGCLGAGTMTGYRGMWLCTTSATSGTLQFRWAQNTTSATADTIINAGSTMIMKRGG